MKQKNESEPPPTIDIVPTPYREPTRRRVLDKARTFVGEETEPEVDDPDTMPAVPPTPIVGSQVEETRPE